MLKMVLQPLVENAILHGFEPKPGPGSIWIEAAETEDGRIRVTVADDGCGMDEMALSVLNEQLQNAPVGAGSGTSIGLLNVAQRLKLYYGGEGGLTVHSVLGQGTRVEIVTPLAPCPGAPQGAREEAEMDV
jgi:two-component system sensor histidine kinase YesM